MRDTMSFLKKIPDGHNLAIKAMAANDELTCEQATSVLFCYESWSHVNEEQWMKATTTVIFEDEWIQINNDGNASLPVSGF